MKITITTTIEKNLTLKPVKQEKRIAIEKSLKPVETVREEGSVVITAENFRRLMEFAMGVDDDIKREVERRKNGEDNRWCYDRARARKVAVTEMLQAAGLYQEWLHYYVENK